MRITITLIAFLLAKAFAEPQIISFPSAFDEGACHPNVTVKAGAPLPPCISVRNIQQACESNGTLPIHYLAHAQCMCSPPSSFFADWQGCRNCIEAHGGLSQRDLARYSVVISSASNALCTGTPTAAFDKVFESVDAKVPAATSGATIMSDRLPGRTDVAFYYTASGSQGVGAITGNATAGAKSTTGSTSRPTERPSGGSVTSISTPTGGAGAPTTSSSKSTNGASPAHMLGVVWFAVVAGGAALVAA